MESWDAGAVRARVRKMAARDPGREHFGADTHRYELTPPLPEAEIRAFEEAHGADLPVEYRSFVAEVGNGLAGPGHGLMPLTIPRPEVGEEWAVDDEWEEDRLPGRLAAPFPLTEPLPGR
ncbi:SMI1/KNR4 family protein [Streptomyces sp. NBC_00648]|uniref:SMI1/KNR4 family protein n=1 Tax=Streptomyces sp. NBC_00648 TaxID=2975797 RepID=UPI0032456260